MKRNFVSDHVYYGIRKKSRTILSTEVRNLYLEIFNKQCFSLQTQEHSLKIHLEMTIFVLKIFWQCNDRFHFQLKKSMRLFRPWIIWERALSILETEKNYILLYNPLIKPRYANLCQKSIYWFYEHLRFFTIILAYRKCNYFQGSLLEPLNGSFIRLESGHKGAHLLYFSGFSCNTDVVRDMVFLGIIRDTFHKPTKVIAG